MKERDAQLLDYDLHLLPGHRHAILSIGIVPHGSAPPLPEAKETIRIVLPIDALHSIAETLSAASALAGTAKRPAPNQH
jgi:hypothetical protein